MKVSHSKTQSTSVYWTVNTSLCLSNPWANPATAAVCRSLPSGPEQSSSDNLSYRQYQWCVLMWTHQISAAGNWVKSQTCRLLYLVQQFVLPHAENNLVAFLSRREGSEEELGGGRRGEKMVINHVLVTQHLLLTLTQHCIIPCLGPRRPGSRWESAAPFSPGSSPWCLSGSVWSIRGQRSQPTVRQSFLHWIHWVITSGNGSYEEVWGARSSELIGRRLMWSN